MTAGQGKGEEGPPCRAEGSRTSGRREKANCKGILIDMPFPFLAHVFFILILVTFDLNYGALSLSSGNLDAIAFLSQK